MSKLWTFGDSFTAGHGCLLMGEHFKGDPYYERYREYVDVNKHIWPSIVAKHLNLDLINEGINGITNDSIFDLVLKNILNFKKNDIVIIQISTSVRFDMPFVRTKSLFGGYTKSKSNRNYIYGNEDSPYFFKTIFSTNVLDDYKNVGKYALMGNIKDNDESLLIGESKYNLIKNFFSEFIHGGKYYERESWRFCHISKIIENMGVKVYLLNEDNWSLYVNKPHNLISLDDSGILQYIIKNKLTILHDTNGKIDDYHPSYKGHEVIAKKILEKIEDFNLYNT